MELINLTPHTLLIRCMQDGKHGTLVSVAPDPRGAARVESFFEGARAIAHHGETIVVARQRFGDVVNLPDPAHDTMYIVSALVKSHPAVRERDDVVYPVEFERDTKGNIVCARALAS